MKKNTLIFLFVIYRLLSNTSSIYAAGVLDNINSAQANIAPKIPLNLNIAGLLTQGGFNLVTFIFFLVGMIFFANLILAAWDYLLSQGDPKRVQAATQRLINAIIGIVMVLASFLIVRVITAVIGLPGLI